MTLTASIIICTYNRADSLRLTLAAVARVRALANLSSELIVVDNASTDETLAVISAACAEDPTVRCVAEPLPGQGIARNTGMAHARGRVIVFTDDDVRPTPGWLDGMCRPILEGHADAVAGGITLAAHLSRPWMAPDHRAWLASNEGICREGPLDSMTGANMAFSREVLAKVPAFDPELGPGALGFGDDTLFSWQLNAAGYRLVSALNVAVEHHPQSHRLLRHSYLAAAIKRGRSGAYINYHWSHATDSSSCRDWLLSMAKLFRERMRRRSEIQAHEGAPIWELSLAQAVGYHRQYMVERRRPRRYDRHGLVKRASGIRRNG